MTDTDQLTRVAQDLTAIEDMALNLLTQAVNKASDHLMPGGHAMVCLAPVANLEAWGNILDTAERLAERPEDYPEVDEDDWEPPLQTLTYWSERWRREHGNEYDLRPSIGSEANYLRFSLDWAWQNEPLWSNFVKDISAARGRLENVLYAGVRVERGAPCLYDECKGRRLTRTINDRGERSKWRCSKCEREWDEDRYAAMVTAANEAAKIEEVGEETWCSVDYAARDTRRSVKTIRTWITRGELATACMIKGRRMQFVNLEAVRKRDREAKRRGGVAA